MADPIRWSELGFSPDEAKVLETFTRGDHTFPLVKELQLWRRWVTEISRGELWVPEELESACTSRDDLEETLVSLPEPLQERVFDYVDELDRAFRDATTPSEHLRDRQTASCPAHGGCERG